MTAEDAEGAARLEIERREAGPVARLVLSRPAKRNALTPRMIDALAAHARALAEDEALRAVVISGEGGAFCGGADLATLAALDAESGRAFITALHHAIDAVRRLPVPTIAVLRGPCLGAGMELAAACDVRLAAEDLVAGMPEVRVGVPSVIEACLLPRLIGWGAAADLVLTGRTMDAAEALRLGFVQGLVPADALDDAVEARLAAVLAAEPAAIRAQKAVLRGWEAEDRPAIAASIEAFAKVCGTGAPARAIAALRAGR